MHRAQPFHCVPAGRHSGHPIARKCMDFRGKTADPGPFSAQEPSHRGLRPNQLQSIPGEIPPLFAARGRPKGRARRRDLARADARLPPEVSRPALRRGRAAVRAPRARDLGAHPFRQPADLGAARRRAGLHDFQLHDSAARGRARRRLRAEAPRRAADPGARSTRSRAGSRPASSRSGTWIITRSSAPTKTIRSGTICRRRSTSGGTSCCTARPSCSRSTSAPPAANRPRIPRRFNGRSAGNGRSRSRRT